MKTTCPGCSTTFRVTPEQLAARGGKVRCGKCQAIFNAKEQMGEKPPVEPAKESAKEPVKEQLALSTPELSPVIVAAPAIVAPEPPEPPTQAVEPEPVEFSLAIEPLDDPVTPAAVPDVAAELELALASPQLAPTETSEAVETTGYKRWNESAVGASPHAATTWPFLLVASVLCLTLATQIAFQFRSSLAVSAPYMRPLLESLSDMLGADIPLPRYPELISIETSDLQADPKRSELLALQATVRNRAAHQQAYPALQLSLTDTQDSVIIRRVFTPGEYLSPKDLNPLVFAANGEISVRLWIEAKDVTPAGYRLYAFYP